jgi:hypothetical protein
MCYPYEYGILYFSQHNTTEQYHTYTQIERERAHFKKSKHEKLSFASRP